MKRPNFFIIGAIKCGTTAMHAYLQEHPQVFMSPLKEPRYFLEGHSDRISSEREYLNLFSAAGPAHRVVGEATPAYIRDEGSLRAIDRFAPRARILAMVRNPIDLAISAHQMFLNIPLPDGSGNFEENEPEFERAWRGQANDYAEFAMLGAQIERVFAIFPRRRVHVVVFDDFVRRTKTCYDRVLEFLEVSPDHRAAFSPVNAAYELRSRTFETALDHRRIPLPLRRFGRYFGLHKLHRRIMEMNKRRVHKQPISPKFRAELYDFFREDVALLGRLLDRDLSHWMNCGSASAKSASKRA